jgi:hypothetical protein
VALDIYPQLLVRVLDFLRCSPSAINNAILKWELEEATADDPAITAVDVGPLDRAIVEVGDAHVGPIDMRDGTTESFAVLPLPEWTG